MNAITDIDQGAQTGISLAASISSDWINWGRGGDALSIRAAFSSSGTFDAAGTLAVHSDPAQVVPFRDAGGVVQTSLSVTSALDGTTFEFIIDPAPRQRYRLVYTRSSGGADDIIDAKWS